MQMWTLSLLTVLVLSTVGVYADFFVPMKQTGNIWKSGNVMKMSGFCEFDLKETMGPGQLVVDLILNRPTRELKIWKMKIDDKKSQNGGDIYELFSKNFLRPQKLNICFIITYDGSETDFPEGNCLVYLPDPSLTTKSFPARSLVSDEEEGMVIPVSKESDWAVGHRFKMTGVCRFLISQTLPEYEIIVRFNKKTQDMTKWTNTIEDQDADGYEYRLKNKWTGYAPEINFRFQIVYFANPPPVGVCILKSIFLPPIHKSSTESPTTNVPTTTTQTPSSPISTSAPSSAQSTRTRATTTPSTKTQASSNIPEATTQSSLPPVTEAPPTSQVPTTTKDTPVISTTPSSTGDTHTGILDLYKKWFNGDGTYHGAGLQGTCSYNPPNLGMPAVAYKMDKMIALNGPQFYGSLSCGMCLRVNGSGNGMGNDPITGSFTVFVKDMCQGCTTGSVVLAERGDGKWDVDIQAIQCPVGDTKINYKFQGANEWYLKLQIRNARIPATKVEMFQPKTRIWSELKHSSDGFWEFGSDPVEKPMKFPINIRLTSANGEVLNDRIPSLDNDVVLNGDGIQFSLDPGLPHLTLTPSTGRPSTMSSTRFPITNQPPTLVSTVRPSTSIPPLTSPPVRSSSTKVTTTKSPPTQTPTTGEKHADILELYQKWFSGDGTYYGEGLGGTCSYNNPNVGLPPVAYKMDKLIALNAPQFFGSLSCGLCLRVNGSGNGLGNDPIVGSFIVFVKDLCPECHAGSVDLAENGDGRWKVDIQAVQCPVGNTKISYKFQGANPWYIKLQIRNARISATKVEMYQPKMRRWSTLKHTNDAFWEFGSDPVEKPMEFPIRVRLTSANGEVLTDTIPNLENDAVINGNGIQFSLDPNLPYITSSGSTGGPLPTRTTTTKLPVTSRPPTGRSTHAPTTISPPTAAPSTGLPSTKAPTTGEKHADILELYQKWFSGDGTYYGEGLEGTCSYNHPNVGLPPVAAKMDKLIALNAPQFFGSLSCGLCLRVNGSGNGLGNDPIVGSFIVFVKDLCPECLAGSVDLAENGDGRWKVDIQAVQCPVGNTKISYKFQGANPWYIKLQIRNARIPATKVEMYQPKMGRWSALRHTTDAFWEFGSDPFEKPMAFPVRVRLTSANGEVLTDSIPRLENDAVINGNGIQFSLDPSLPYVDYSPSTGGPPPSSRPPTVAPTSARPFTTKSTAVTSTRPPSTSAPTTGEKHSGILSMYKSWYKGDGTYYGEGLEGTCSYNPPNLGLPPVSYKLDKLIALNSPQFFGSLSCGMCLRVNGSGDGLGNDPIIGSYTVFVKDLCPGCNTGSVDLAENGDGRWKVDIQAVQCPVGNTKISYKFQGTNPWYIKLQIRNARIPATKVEMYQPKMVRWSALRHTTDAFWEFGSDPVEKPMEFPILVRLTSANGEVLRDNIPRLENDVLINGNGIQFSLDPNLPYIDHSPSTGGPSPSSPPPTVAPTSARPPAKSSPTALPSTRSPSTSTPTTGEKHNGVLGLYRNWYKGDGTYYGEGLEGTCSYNPPNLGLPPVAYKLDKLIALNAPQFFGSLSCGMCLRVNGSGDGLGSDPIVGSYTVFVKDLCPGCNTGSVDIAENGDGRWKVDIQAMQCPVGNTKITYKFQGTNAWYIKIQMRNTRIPVTKVEMYQPKMGRWSNLRHTSDAFWEFGSDPVEKPMQVPLLLRMTSANGQVLTDNVPSIDNDVIINGNGVQFPLDPTLPH